MGVSYYTYIGPYVRVFNPLKDSTEKYNSCPNASCSNHKKLISGGFCSKCGSKMSRLTRPSKERIRFDFYRDFDNNSNLRDVYNDFGNHDYMHFLDEGDLHILIDNRSEETIKDLTDKNPAAELDMFKALRNKEIAKLKKVFGNDAVDVKWGVITYTC